MNRYLIFLFVLFSIFSSLFSTTYYVSHTGSRTLPYDSWETATDSIGEAVALCSGGDTVRIAVGEWREYIDMPPFTTIIGSGMDSTIIRKTESFSADYVVLMDTFCTISDLYLEAEDWDYAIAAYDHCNIHTIRAYAHFGGILFTFIHGLFIFGCVFNSPTSNAGPSGIWEKNIIFGPDFFIDNSFGSEGAQIIKNNIFFKHSLLLFCARDSTIIKNNLCLNDRANYAISIGNGMLFENNTILTGAQYDYLHRPWKNNSNVFNSNSGEPLERTPDNTGYNCFIPPYDDPYSVIGWNGNISADPMFVDDFDSINDPIVDLHLQWGSPCIDAGNPDPRYNDVDGSRNDIGCYGGPGGESYFYLDLAPDVPDSFSGYGDSTYFHLRWKSNTETELSHYTLYCGWAPDFPTIPAHKVLDIYAPDTTYDLGPYPFGTSSYFKLTATDTAGHESAATSALLIVIDNIQEENEVIRPVEISLEGAFPNPFNETTRIKFRLRASGSQTVVLRIFDKLGRQVKTIIGTFEPGYHELEWDGADDTGIPLPSAIYFLRLSSGNDVGLRTATILR